MRHARSPPARLRVSSVSTFSKGQAREVSARPAKLSARTDWTFTFADGSLAPLPEGELRMDVVIAGEEISKATRYVFVPEQWERRTRAAETRNLIIRICVGVIFGGLLVAAAVSGIVAWSRRRYAARLFAVTSLLMFLAALVNTANNWPTTLAQMQTALPFAIQVGGVIGAGIVALIVAASLTGLAMGALPRRLAVSGSLPDRDALTLGAAGGLFGAALTVVAASLRAPVWAHTSDVPSLGTYLPLLDLAIDPLTGLLNRIAVVATFLAGVSLITDGWTHRRIVGIITLVVVGFLGAGAPAGANVTGWAAAGALLAAGMVLAYVFLLRADLTMVPIALGTMVAFGALARGSQRVFPGALVGSVIAVLVIGAAAWWIFRALRYWRAEAAAPG